MADYVLRVLTPEQGDTRYARPEQVPELVKSNVALSPRTLLGNRWVFDGDSITIGGISTNPAGQDRGSSWVNELARRSMGRIDYIYNAAVSGTRTDQAITRFDTSVTPYSPDVVLLSMGTNDMSQGRTMEQFLSDLETYRQKCEAIGARMVLGGIYPKTTRQSEVATWNRAAHTWAMAKGVPHIPFWELANPVDGSWPAGWSTDGTHPVDYNEALSKIGKFAWNYLEPICGPSTARLPYYMGSGLLSQFGTDLTATITGSITGTLSSTTGSLPAGTYEYKIAVMNQYGTKNGADTKSITLGSTGGVTITRAASGTYSRWVVFRKAPGESTFRFMTLVATGTGTWTDNGSVTPGDWVYQDVDATRVPVGLVAGTGEIMTNQYGPLVQSESGIRGNFLRFQKNVTSGGGTPYWHFEVTGLTPGQTVELTMKARALITTTDTTTRPSAYLRWRSASASLSPVIVFRQWIDTDWTMPRFRGTVPPDADRVRVSFELQSTTGVQYLDVAEISLELV